MNAKGWIIFAVVVVVLLGGLIGLSYANKPKIDLSKVNVNAPIAAQKQNGNIADHVFGNAKSPVVLIEYGDYQCPYCGEAEPALSQVYTAYQDQIAFVFRNFPLTTIHPNALAAAAAAEAAGLQGKYWEMHDQLYGGQQTWENLSGSARTNAFVTYAQQIGINTTKFRQDLSNPKLTQKIQFDEAIGSKLGINATPTMYLNDKKLGDDVTGDLQSSSTKKLESALNTELKAHGITPPSSKS